MSVDYLKLDYYEDLDNEIPGLGLGGRNEKGELEVGAIMDAAQFYSNHDIGDDAVLAFGKFTIEDKSYLGRLDFHYSHKPEKASVFISILENYPKEDTERIFVAKIPFTSLDSKADLKTIFLSSMEKGLDYVRYLKSWCVGNIPPNVFEELVTDHDEYLKELDMSDSDVIPESFWLYAAEECGDVSLLKYEDFLKTKHPSPEKEETVVHTKMGDISMSRLNKQNLLENDINLLPPGLCIMQADLKAPSGEKYLISVDTVLMEESHPFLGEDDKIGLEMFLYNQKWPDEPLDWKLAEIPVFKENIAKSLLNEMKNFVENSRELKYKEEKQSFSR